MELIDGNKIAADIIAELKAEVATLTGRKPCIALVRVGEDPASVSYVTKKVKTSAEIGIESRLILQPVTLSQDELFTVVDQLNADPTVDGIITALRPDVHAKGTDYTVDSVPEAALVQTFGGRVAIVGDPKNHATSLIMQQLGASIEQPRSPTGPSGDQT